MENRDNHQNMSMSDKRDPIEILKWEHNEGLKHLSRLENATESLQHNGFSAEAFEEIADSIRWINTDVRRHTEKEEKYLLPLLDRHVVGLPDIVRNEHRELRSAFGQLLDAVQDVEEGKIRGSTIQEIVQIATMIVELMRKHIATEDNLLFPMTKEILTTQEYSDLKQLLAFER